MTRSTDIEMYLPYIFEVLIQRLNCHDLEGVEGVDPRYIPSPSQKPHKMARILEESEQVRERLLDLAKVLIESLS